MVGIFTNDDDDVVQIQGQILVRTAVEVCALVVQTSVEASSEEDTLAAGEEP